MNESNAQDVEKRLKEMELYAEGSDLKWAIQTIRNLSNRCEEIILLKTRMAESRKALRMVIDQMSKSWRPPQLSASNRKISALTTKKQKGK